MTNLVKCSVCCKVLINEEASSHVCNPRLKRCKTIEIAWYFVHTDERGSECVYATAVNGTAYRLVVKERSLMPLSNDSLQPI